MKLQISPRITVMTTPLKACQNGDIEKSGRNRLELTIEEEDQFIYVYLFKMALPLICWYRKTHIHRWHTSNN